VNSATRALLGIPLALLVAGVPRRAMALAPPGSLGVVVHGCGGDLREVRELPERLAVELAPARVKAGATPVVDVATSCTAVESVTFHYGELTRTRRVSLEDVAPALRPVALAVLTAEFLRSIWETPEDVGVTAPLPAPDPAPSVTPDAAPLPTSDAARPVTPDAKPAEKVPTVVTRAATVAPSPASPVSNRRDRAEPTHGASRKRGSVQLGADAVARYFPDPTTLLAGAGISVGIRPFFSAVDVSAGSNQVSLGGIALGVAAVSFGGRLRIAELYQTTLYAAAALELGYSWASATGIGSASARDVFAAVGAGPELALSVTPAFDVVLGVRAGVARGMLVTADSRRSATTQGFTVTSTVGVRFAP
jgi:hypothetical protein